MRIIEFYIKNSKHLSAAINKDEVLIDLRINDNVLNVIIGQMGSGKTVILGLMQPFANFGTIDKRNDDGIFLPGKNGIKRVIYKHNGNQYTCEHIATWKKDRHTIKSFFRINGEEMNENGNQASFKELVKLYLGIEPSYLTLLRLGSNVTSLMDKSSTDRKAFVSDLLPDTEIYTVLFKGLKEDYRNLNAQIKVLANKLQSLSGSKYDDFKQALIESTNGLTKSKSEENELLKESYQLDAEIRAILDGISYKDAENEKEQYDKILEKLDIERSVLKERVELLTMDDISPEEVTNTIAQDNLTIQFLQADIQKLDEDHAKNTKIINKMINDLKIMQSSDQMENLQKEYEKLKMDITEMEIDLQDYKCEFSLRELQDIVESISQFNETIAEIRMYNTESVKHIFGSDSTIVQYSKKRIAQLSKRKMYLQTKSNNIKFLEKYEPTEKLYLPPFCPTKDCPYHKTHPSVAKAEVMDTVISQIQRIENEVQDIDTDLFKYSEYPIIYNMITSYKRQWGILSKKLKKLGVLNIESPLTVLLNPMNEKWFHYNKLMDIVNLASRRENYYKIMDRFDKIKAELQSYNKSDMDSLSDKIDFYSNQNSEILQTMEKKANEISDLKEELTKYTKLLSDLNNLELITRAYEEADQKYQETKDIYLKLSEKLKKCKSLYMDLDEVKVKLENIKRFNQEYEEKVNQMSQLVKDIEYTNEEYQEALMNVRYYEYMIKASSSKEGIPLEYIKIFLNKTKGIINRLIANVFEDDIEIVDFDINETEFKIPYSINGMMVDDISRLSQGQTSIIGLATSFAFVNTSGIDYNIFLLDEVDGPLHINSKRKFIQLILNQLKEIDAEQIFLITHNREFEGFPVNLIMTTDENIADDRNFTLIRV